MSAVSIGRNNSIVVSNSLSGLSRKLPNQATSVISGVTQVSQTVSMPCFHGFTYFIFLCVVYLFFFVQLFCIKLFR